MKPLKIILFSSLFFSPQLHAEKFWQTILDMGRGGLIGVTVETIKQTQNQKNKNYTIKIPNIDITDQKQTTQSNKVTFDDIAGIDSVVTEVKDVVDFLKNPQKYKNLGAKLPKGILLQGPPGTGKTLLAKAIANESGCSFHYASASSFVELYVGQGAKHVRELFEKANKQKPAIIFIDEIDAIGAINRGSTGSSGTDEYRQTLNELLCQMDGFKENNSILIIGATNNAQALDKAIKRPGRFTRIIQINKPDKKAREEILLHYINKLPKIDLLQSDLENLAVNTLGFSGAELENLVNEAAIFAVKENVDMISKKHLELALVKVKQRNT